MVKDSMDLMELLRKRGMDGDVDFLREALRVLMDAIMDAEVSARIGAEHGERSPDRLTHRNGYRSRWMGFDPSDGRAASCHRTSHPAEPVSHTANRTAVGGAPVPTRSGRGPSSEGTLRHHSPPASRAQRIGPVPVRAHCTRRGAENEDQDATPQGDDEKEVPLSGRQLIGTRHPGP